MATIDKARNPNILIINDVSDAFSEVLIQRILWIELPHEDENEEDHQKRVAVSRTTLCGVKKQRLKGKAAASK